MRPRVPELFPAHALARLDFARRHSGGNFNNWVWIDEARFSLNPSSNPPLYMIANGEKPDIRQVIRPSVKDRGGLIVLGAVSLHGTMPLVFIENTIDKVGYKDIICTYLIPYLMQLGIPLSDLVLAHDNDPKHKAVVNELRAMGLNFIDWPARSPDLNPIEHCWSNLKYDLSCRGKRSYSKIELLDTLVALWSSLTEDYIHSLYTGYQKRLDLVIENEGWYTLK